MFARKRTAAVAAAKSEEFRSPTEVRAELENRLRDLGKTENALIAEVCALETTLGARAPEPEDKARLRHAAEALAAGVEVLDMRGAPPERILIAQEKLQAVRAAIVLVQRRLVRVY